MIAVDTSAIMAILLDESTTDACIGALVAHDEIVMSAGTLAETLIVAGRRGVGTEAARLVEGLGVDVVPLTPQAAPRLATIYARWGKGRHPAALNFGDCFAYDVAEQNACPLLFVGEDFAQTDARSVL